MLLAADDIFAGLLVTFDRMQAQLVEQYRHLPNTVGELNCVAGKFLLQGIKERTLEGENEHCRFVGREAGDHPAPRQFIEKSAYIRPLAPIDVVQLQGLQGWMKEIQKLLRLISQLCRCQPALG